jgi:hypothetical protein
MSRILTFNCHEGYVHLLGKIDTSLDIIDGLPHRHVASWDTRMRPIPSGARCITLEQAHRSGPYDAVLAHNIADLLDSKHLDAPKILILHVSLKARMLEEPGAPPADAMSHQVRAYLELIGATAVAVSTMKRDSWGLDAQVIRPTADPDEYHGYHGSGRRILRVANHVSRRPARFAWHAHERIVDGLPFRLMGTDPNVPTARPSKDWDDLKEAYRSHRLYVHTATEGLDDGYNLAVIEAMCSGMPVVTTGGSGSPVVDGLNGFSADDPASLNQAARYLLDNPAAAKELGERARETVRRDFSTTDFIDGWHGAIENAQRAFKRVRPRASIRAPNPRT